MALALEIAAHFTKMHASPKVCRDASALKPGNCGSVRIGQDAFLPDHHSRIPASIQQPRRRLPSPQFPSAAVSSPSVSLGSLRMLFAILVVASAVMAPPSASATPPAPTKSPAAVKRPAVKQSAVKRPAVRQQAAKPSTKARFALYQIEKEVIAKTNAERARRGLRPLKTDVRLVRSARRHTA